MENQEVNFLYLANNLAVDFINTSIVDRGNEIELLEDVDDLIRWGHSAGLSVRIDVDGPCRLSSVKELRDAIRSLFSAKLDDEPAPTDALGILNQWLPKGVVEKRLEEIEGQFVMSPLHHELSVDMLLGYVATEAALLLSSSHLAKLKRCANPKCVLMFLDVSRSGKRRWCSMDLCGNRSKAATYYTNTKN